jgi:O-antigen chain-terminating methyltransferase
MINNFYRAFEERFRGSRDLIKTRLQIYLPFVLPVRDYYSLAKAVDLGCGRGEWIELLV